eukprot:3738049-Rhodomonas_salina.2
MVLWYARTVLFAVSPYPSCQISQRPRVVASPYAIVLRACYAMSGTDIAYRATRHLAGGFAFKRIRIPRRKAWGFDSTRAIATASISAYAYGAMPCPVLTSISAYAYSALPCSKFRHPCNPGELSRAMLLAYARATDIAYGAIGLRERY